MKFHKNDIQPPRWSLKLLRYFLRNEFSEEVEGDMEEVYQDNLEKYSKSQARRKYNREVIKLLRPVLIKRVIQVQKLTSMNTLVHSYRKFQRKPFYSILNSIGFAIGVFCLIIILTHLHKESHYDQFNTKSERIVRVNKHVLNLDGGIENHLLTSGPMAVALQTDYPAVEQAVRVLPWNNEEIIKYEEKALKSKGLLFVDRAFFEMFDFELVLGDKNQALEDNRTIILSEGLADGLFGNDSPIGKTVKGFKDNDLIVSGVVKNRSDSHLQFDAIMPIDILPTVGIDWLNRWYPQMLFTYLLLNDISQKEALAAQMPDFMHKYFPQKEEQYSLYFQDFRKIYTHSDDLLYNGKMKSGNQLSNASLWAVAGIILLLVVINFINLSTVSMANNSKGIIIQSILGIARFDVFRQFLTEAFIKVIVAITLALAGVYLLMDQIARFVTDLNIQEIFNP